MKGDLMGMTNSKKKKKASVAEAQLVGKKMSSGRQPEAQLNHRVFERRNKDFGFYSVMESYCRVLDRGIV